MGIESSVTSLTMSDDTSVSVPSRGIIVFVGPNNSGKSLSLRNLHDRLYAGASPPQAVNDMKVEKSGTEDDLAVWLDAIFSTDYRNGQRAYLISGNSLSESGARHSWTTGPPYGDLMPALVFYAAGEGRLQAVNSVESFDVRGGTLTQ